MDLLRELTTAEKLALLHQAQPAVPRLGLAAFHTGCEALHGVAWLGPATVFPQAVGLGATWDRGLLREVGAAAGTEVRALHHDDGRASLNVWAPVVNPLRDPRWGRNEEGYSEDPFATAQLAIAYCTGLRGDDPSVWRTTPVLKHFLAYNVETLRDKADIAVPERVLHEYELPAFLGPLRAGVVAGVMPGYNLVNGVPNHVHPLLRVLRSAAPDVVICSDAYAPSNLLAQFPTAAEGHAAALLAGVDSYTDNGPDGGPTVAAFTEALDRGLVTLADVDAAVGRILAMRAWTGEFSRDADPYAGTPREVVAGAEHGRLAARAARAGIVLLKNAGGALPLSSPGSLPGTVAVVGHLGDRVLRDWYSGSLPYAVTVADGLRDRLGADRVTAVDGLDRVRIPLFGDTVLARQDWGTSVQCPVPVHTFRAPSGYLTADDAGVLSLDAPTPDGWEVRELWELHPVDGGVALRSNALGRFVTAALTATGSLDDAAAFAVEPVSSGIEAAVAAASAADRVVVVLGNDPHINGRETVDRDGLALPAEQEALLRAVCAANPATVLVLVSSYPYAVDWAQDHVPAILWTSHAGQELGSAVADVLLGTVNPGGRLPQTWYRGDTVLPAPTDYDVIGSGWTYQYFRGEPLYPFGHGLSYTTFAYGPLTVDGPTARVTVTNTGERDGDEVVQLYVTPHAWPVPSPSRRLAAFERVPLAAGESREVVLDVAAEALAHWSGDGLVTPPGSYTFTAGPSAVTVSR
ncbi:beta-glucosidase [Dactylosporangium sucinum]|uniref:Beta-glucosidase n=1 Tax=Dactylosporangium sucinum TaxID=1424081 RepID=A0A917T0Y6_9ACTN|nr:glycoside hydrolase family 3 C-terminal domain-containing protein [Dactylosporangium sucinum]GGM05110.1 beta-glucosidase [Dactylosporangium sucinum]